jgi:twitching motility protein PilT
MTRDAHIITVEDPIEFVHPNLKSLINQREVGSHTKSFANALKAALREDPDILLVGELRDLETISLALTAAETGHVVFGTLHTNSAAKTVDRIIDVFPAGQQAQIRTMLAESLRGVVAQTLFSRADGQGRVAAYEILRNTKAIANLIREGKIHQIASAMQTGSSQGMVLFEKYIDDLVKKGKVSAVDAKTFLGLASETTVQGTLAGGGNPAPQGTAASPRPNKAG